MTDLDAGELQNIKTKFGIVGNTPELNLAITKAVQIAKTDLPVLITGESGVGKEIFPKIIHFFSPRRHEKYIAVNCGAIPEGTMDSELFGHVKGSFTDAHTDRIGRFEAANGGTLFLDEIANLPYHLQAKLLTAIQKRSFVRVGSNQPCPTDIRLICATNRNLDTMVREGTFREDLLYRINTIHLHIPPLRERKEDILPLAERFMKQYNIRYGRNLQRFSDDTRKRLLAHPWYGNIRELQHTIEKAVILADGEILQTDALQFSPPVHSPQPLEKKTGETIQTIDEMERNLITRTIAQCNGNLSQAASQLGITRQTLYNKMKRYDL